VKTALFWIKPLNCKSSGGLLRGGGDLSKLSDEQEVVRVTERTSLSADVEITEERKNVDNAISVHSIVRHLRVPGANRLTLDATKLNGLLLWVVLDDLD